MADRFPHITAPGAFKDKTIIINGACGAIGSATTQALAASGANLILNDIKPDAITSTIQTLHAAGHTNISGYTFPSTSGAELVAKAIETHGAVHAVINAQLVPVPFKPFENLTDADFLSLYETLVLGPLNLTRAAWPYFQAQKFGRVVNFTSDGMLGMPTGTTYTTCKGALFGVNKTLAAEGAAHNIKVNCVSPIAYRPSMDPLISHFGEDVKAAFRERYTPAANVPMILALVSEACEVSGEVFQTAGWAVGRSVWGSVEGEAGMETMEDCLEMVGRLCEKGGRAVFEPAGMAEYTAFQIKYALEKS